MYSLNEKFETRLKDIINEKLNEHMKEQEDYDDQSEDFHNVD